MQILTQHFKLALSHAPQYIGSNQRKSTRLCKWEAVLKPTKMPIP